MRRRRRCIDGNVNCPIATAHAARNLDSPRHGRDAVRGPGREHRRDDAFGNGRLEAGNADRLRSGRLHGPGRIAVRLRRRDGQTDRHRRHRARYGHAARQRAGDRPQNDGRFVRRNAGRLSLLRRSGESHAWEHRHRQALAARARRKSSRDHRHGTFTGADCDRWRDVVGHAGDQAVHRDRTVDRRRLRRQQRAPRPFHGHGRRRDRLRVDVVPRPIAALDPRRQRVGRRARPDDATDPHPTDRTARAAADRRTHEFVGASHSVRSRHVVSAGRRSRRERVVHDLVVELRDPLLLRRPANGAHRSPARDRPASIPARSTVRRTRSTRSTAARTLRSIRSRW